MNPHRAVRALPERRSIAADDGMTLVELLVAITVLLIVLAGVAAGASSGLQLARGNSSRIVAANVADQQIGDVRAMDFAAIPQATVTGTVTQGAVDYTWTRDADMVFVGADDSCEAPSGAFSALSYLRVIVEVSWPQMEGIDPVRSETLIDPPVTEYDPFRGHLSVEVTDRDGGPVPGMTVYLRNANASTPSLNTFATTDANGCVFFENLQVIPGQTVGNYHVWLNRSGWVDRATGLTDTSAQTPRPAVDVVSAQLRKVEFNYDRAAYLSVDTAGAFGGTPADDLPITIANDNYNNGNGPVVFDSPALLAAQPLHPFSAGFSLWAGRCSDADPGTTARTRLVTNPNATTAGTVTLGTVQMTVYRRDMGSDVPVSDALIEAQDACGNVHTVSGTRTDASGTATIALPYGQWTLSVQGMTPRRPNRWPEVTLSPSDTAPQTISKRVR